MRSSTDPLHGGRAVPRHSGGEQTADPASTFVGRVWVFARIDEWLAAAGPRHFLLTGEPGSGKSALANRWVDLVSHFGRPVTYAHFCRANDDRTLNPVRFVEALSASLAELHAPFRAALEQALSVPRTVTVTQEVGHVAPGGRVTGVEIRVLPGEASPRELFDLQVRRPLESLRDAGHAGPLVIVVDGLDEALTWPGSESIVDLLAHAGLPSTVRLVLTSRPDPRVLAVLGRPTLDLTADEPEDTDDVLRYALARVGSRSAGSALAERVAAAAGGNFLYARYVLDDLTARPPDPDDAARGLDLPAGLVGHYQEFLDRELARHPDRWEKSYRVLLGLVTVARGEGLTRTQILEITGMEPQMVDDGLRAIAHYAVGVPPDGPFRLYHQSLREYLAAPGRHCVYPASANRAVAVGLLRAFEGRGPYAVDRYSLDHLVEHALLSEDPEVLDSLSRSGFLATKADDVSIAEALTDARACARQVAGLGPGQRELLVRFAETYCSLSESLRAAEGTLELLCLEGDLSSITALLDAEPNRPQRELLRLAAAAFLRAAGRPEDANALAPVGSTVDLLFRRARLRSLADALIAHTAEPPIPRLAPPPRRARSAPLRSDTGPRSRPTPTSCRPPMASMLAANILSGRALVLVPVGLLAAIAAKNLLGVPGWLTLCAYLTLTLSVLLGGAVVKRPGLARRWQSGYRSAYAATLDAAWSAEGEARAALLRRALRLHSVLSSWDQPVPAADLGRLAVACLRSCVTRAEAAVVVQQATAGGPAVCDAVAAELVRQPQEASRVVELAWATRHRVESRPHFFHLVVALSPHLRTGLVLEVLYPPSFLDRSTGAASPLKSPREMLVDDLGRLSPVALARVAVQEVTRPRPPPVEWARSELSRVRRVCRRWTWSLRVPFRPAEAVAAGLLLVPEGLAALVLLVVGTALWFYVLAVAASIIAGIGLLGRTYGTGRSRWPRLGTSSGRAVDETLIAELVLLGGVVGGDDLRAYPDVALRRALGKLRARIGITQPDVVLRVMGNRRLLQAATSVPERRERDHAPRTVAAEDRARQERSVRPIRPRSASCLITVVVAGLVAGAWASVAGLTSPSPSDKDLLPDALALAALLAFAQHLGREPPRRGLGDLDELKLGKGVVVAAVVLVLALALSMPAWLVAVSVVLTNLAVPMAIAGFRGAGLLYPRRRRLWQRRAVWVATMGLLSSVVGVLAGRLLA